MIIIIIIMIILIIIIIIMYSVDALWQLISNGYNADVLISVNLR